MKALVEERNWQTWLWLAGGLVPFAICVGVIIWIPGRELPRGLGWFPGQSHAFAVAMALGWLILITAPMHRFDEGAMGYRFLHKVQRTKHRMEDAPISGFLSVLSNKGGSHVVCPAQTA